MVKKYRFSLLLSVIILLLSLAGPATFERVDFLDMTFTDKLAHMCMYFALMSVLTWENKLYHQRPSILIVLALIAFMYGTLMELFQEYLTTNRTGSFWDGLFNTFGIMLASAMWLILRNYPWKKNIR